MTSLAIQPGGQILASAGEDRVLRLWDTKTGKLIGAFLGEGYAVAWSPDGKVLAAVGANCLVLREAGTWRHLRTIPGGKSFGGLSTVAWSPQGSLIAWWQEVAALAIQVVRPDTGETVRTLPLAGSYTAGGFIVWSPDGEMIATRPCVCGI